MKVIIKEQWAKATGKDTDKESRTFDVVETSHNLLLRKGYDTFYKVDIGNGYWTIAHAHVEEVVA